MRSTWKVDGRGGVLKFDTCLRILLFLNNRSVVHFCGWWGLGSKNWSFLGDLINGWPLKTEKHLITFSVSKSIALPDHLSVFETRPVLWKTWQQLPPLINQLNDVHVEELDSVQKFIEIQGWLLRTFFIYLHNQLSSFKSIFVQMSEIRDLSSRQ